METAPKPVGPYSQAVESGCFMFVSGQIPINPETGALEEGGFKESAKRALDNLKAIVEGAGYSMDDIVKVTVYITDISRFSEFNEVYREYFNRPYPARAVVGVAALPLGAPLEVEAVLYTCRRK
ncbi:ribonuclease UK114 [Aeropyrum pernix]|uniref:Ribonuclease UK114 n=1 Tax=Aeropyrum pernix TaxID=56636 RepID=A0A401H8D3_AERPX|nr:Chain A, putative endonuclease [Aeropyrum pernix K1]GBF08687.1 ribonuclease UK114 [Aeropyrum pernix]